MASGGWVYNFYTYIKQVAGQACGNIVSCATHPSYGHGGGDFNVNFNLMEILMILALRKNFLPSSSLILSLNPAMLNDPLNELSLNNHLEDKLANLPPFPQQENLTSEELHNLYVFYNTRAMDIQKGVLIDLVDVAIDKY